MEILSFTFLKYFLNKILLFCITETDCEFKANVIAAIFFVCFGYLRQFFIQTRE